ncbi:MAG TPA: HAD family phosphatase [Spirochaetota bacterium]|nr:HAD family phosphatase [Spirochaetota bacterium]HPC41053.1 HAD family phosphatase [Spirochaetota bacterium]HPL18531.1 HAD family phosphatase [Spirochaetota bacterium]HQF08834.1 HAD family phosphatase [Spirochaetota bacterium]HQH97453.1 HAD family phosphatase [Spirochaetota bacterium]
MTIDAILFDMDGVVVDSMPSHADAWKRVLGEFGLELDDIDIFRREGMSGRQSVEDIFIEKERPVPGESEFHDLIAKKHAIFEECEIRLFPHIVEILAWIRGRGIRAALVTGSQKRSVNHLLPAEVLSRFDVVIAAEDVTRGKPDPEPYLRALDALGVRPERALIIENAPMGIRAARAAGIACVALETTLPRRYLSGADRIFGGHRELLEYLKSAAR